MRVLGMRFGRGDHRGCPKATMPYGIASATQTLNPSMYVYAAGPLGRASGVATTAAACQARPAAPSAPARRQRSAPPVPPASSSQASPRGPSSPAPPNRHAWARSRVRVRTKG